MREFVAVASGYHFTDTSTLKRAALMFRRVGVTTFCAVLESLRGDEAKEYRKLHGIRELEWLMEQGIAFAPESLYNRFALEASNKEYRKYEAMEARASKKFDKAQWERRILKMDFMILDIKEETGPLWDKVNKKHDDAWNAMQDADARRAAVGLRQCGDYDVVPLVSATPIPVKARHAGKTDVLKFVLNQLPVPNESVSWEQIIEYRSDPDSQSKFLALRHWMSEVARAELTPAEVEEKLEYLIDQYQKHMRLHRMKTNVGTLETVVTTSLEVISDLLTIKWHKAAEALFSLKRRRVALLEGELTAPGNEVAYIVKARESFS